MKFIYYFFILLFSYIELAFLVNLPKYNGLNFILSIIFIVIFSSLIFQLIKKLIFLYNNSKIELNNIDKSSFKETKSLNNNYKNIIDTSTINSKSDDISNKNDIHIYLSNTIEISNNSNYINLINAGYLNTLEYEKNSHNIKRSTYEEELSFNFFNKYSSKLNEFENKLYDSSQSISGIYDIDIIILRLKSTISIFYEYKNFCYSKGKGGVIYFQDMWEHCHNNKNPDFCYIEDFENHLNYLLNNYDSEKDRLYKKFIRVDFKKDSQKRLLNFISQNQGILQKDLYKFFDLNFKSIIQRDLKYLENKHLIIRLKEGNSYKLFIVPNNESTK